MITMVELLMACQKEAEVSSMLNSVEVKKPRRTPIQIAASASTIHGARVKDMLYILCNDGVIFVVDSENGRELEWTRLQEVPQDE